ncbi:hypothetical protein EWM64_g7851 [Hericium alpestre]|uniref:Peptidase A1 domain-containing protein n=1 Tax=Hericium alpestre TaxID=135208 RepID=A0A4Y9ZN02_9AGAM|nr:hypothetical protein EWM64_g7851 [Hericium alpestre]
MKTSAFLAGLLAASASRSLALQIPVQRRADSGKGVSMSRAGTALLNGQNVLYETTVTVAGQDFNVQLDTGSSDFWIFKDAGVEATDIGPVNLTYGTGNAVGNVSFAPFSLGNYKVESQAFINNADYTKQFKDLMSDLGSFGILGISFDSISSIDQNVILATNDTIRGRSPLSNIFASNPSVPNTVSILLSRTDDQEETAGGSFLIGEEAEGYENVLKAPQLPRFTPAGRPGIWTVWLDGATLNGTFLSFKSILKDAPKGKTLTLLDSGSTAANVPSSLAKGLYGNIPGSFIDPSSRQYIIPCLSASNLSLTFGGQEFPVHPLDLTQVQTSVADDGTNFTYCTGYYTPDDATPDSVNNEGEEILLGDAFMRNVYSSFNYGNDSIVRFDNGSFKDVVSQNPYIQLLKLTDQDKAWAEFFDVRKQTLKTYPPEPSLDKVRQYLDADSSSGDGMSDGNGDDKNSDDSQNAAIQGGASSDDSDSSMSQLLDKLDKYSPIVIGLLAGNVIIGLLLCAIALATCIHRGASTKRVGPTYAPVRFKDGGSGEEVVYTTPKYSD